MHKKMSLAIGLATTTVLAGAALAQTAMQPKAMPTQPSAANVQSDARYITQNRRDLWRASKLEGVDVYNDSNEQIGEINEVLVNRQGQVEAVVIGVGGFLGLGEHDVAVPFSALKWDIVNASGVASNVDHRAATVGTATNKAPPTSVPAANTGTAIRVDGRVNDGRIAATRYDRNRDYPARAILPGATKDQLKNAPEFKYAT